MTLNKKEDGGKKTSDLCNKILKVYEPPTLTTLDAMNIETGSMNVPENSNGLLES